MEHIAQATHGYCYGRILHQDNLQLRTAAAGGEIHVLGVATMRIVESILRFLNRAGIKEKICNGNLTTTMIYRYYEFLLRLGTPWIGGCLPLYSLDYMGTVHIGVIITTCIAGIVLQGTTWFIAGIVIQIALKKLTEEATKKNVPTSYHWNTWSDALNHLFTSIIPLRIPLIDFMDLSNDNRQGDVSAHTKIARLSKEIMETLSPACSWRRSLTCCVGVFALSIAAHHMLARCCDSETATLGQQIIHGTFACLVLATQWHMKTTCHALLPVVMCLYLLTQAIPLVCAPSSFGEAVLWGYSPWLLRHVCYALEKQWIPLFEDLFTLPKVDLKIPKRCQEFRDPKSIPLISEGASEVNTPRWMMGAQIAWEQDLPRSIPPITDPHSHIEELQEDIFRKLQLLKNRDKEKQSTIRCEISKEILSRKSYGSQEEFPWEDIQHYIEQVFKSLKGDTTQGGLEPHMRDLILHELRCMKQADSQTLIQNLAAVGSVCAGAIVEEFDHIHEVLCPQEHCALKCHRAHTPIPRLVSAVAQQVLEDRMSAQRQMFNFKENFKEKVRNEGYSFMASLVDKDLLLADPRDTHIAHQLRSETQQFLSIHLQGGDTEDGLDLDGGLTTPSIVDQIVKRLISLSRRCIAFFLDPVFSIDLEQCFLNHFLNLHQTLHERKELTGEMKKWFDQHQHEWHALLKRQEGSSFMRRCASDFAEWYSTHVGDVVKINAERPFSLDGEDLSAAWSMWMKACLFEPDTPQRTVTGQQLWLSFCRIKGWVEPKSDVLCHLPVPMRAFDTFLAHKSGRFPL